MFSTLRNRFGIPGVISVIALVFAMFGGAYAASNSSDGNGATASAKKAAKGPKGAKGAKGATGAAGPVGPAGPAGPQGAAGANGKDGANGQDGADGKSVEVDAIPTGEEDCEERGGALVKEEGAVGGVELCNGSPWTAGGKLPAGATLTGSWSTLGEGLVPVGFPIPLEVSLEEGAVHNVTQKMQEKEEVPAFCTVEGVEGSAENPLAEPGHFCVYTGNVHFDAEGNTKIEAILPSGEPEAIHAFFTGKPGAQGASTAGSMLLIFGPGAIWGTWAVAG